MKTVRLPAAQKLERNILGPSDKPTCSRRGNLLFIRHLRARCEQKLAAFWKPGIVGTWKTSGSILIQPAVMDPRSVARCDALYTLCVQLPQDAADAVSVLERGDAYASPPEWQRLA